MKYNICVAGYELLCNMYQNPQIEYMCHIVTANSVATYNVQHLDILLNFEQANCCHTSLQQSQCLSVDSIAIANGYTKIDCKTLFSTKDVGKLLSM